MPAAWNIQTPTAAAGAIAIIQLTAPDPAEINDALDRLGIAPVVVGSVALRDLCGIDKGLIARWTPRLVHVMPHGGPAILRALAARLASAGLEHNSADDPGQTYPESRSLLEARMLDALSRAASPLGIDLLLDQPRRWAGFPGDPDAAPQPALADPALNRLIDPPLVVSMGAANIGKSSLLNALAGRRVAIVADEPGTTRDHIGVLIDMAGLVVRYVDTPGELATASPIQAEAAAISREVTSAADLVLSCGDAGMPPLPSRATALRIALRTDRGLPAWPFDAAVCAPSGQGLSTLVARIRDHLVPPSTLNDRRPWRFWSP